MKLLRHGEKENEKPGIEINGKRYDVSPWFKDYNEEFFKSDGLESLEKVVQDHETGLKEISIDVRLGSPVARPSKIVCIGLNYIDHARETNATPPTEPVIFLKSTTALCGPFDDIVIPKNSKKTDWEVELGVVISKRASYVEEDDAMNYIAGYCVHNDISEREFQLERSGTWDKGKGCDTFAPIGPYLVTQDEVADVHKLRLWLSVNGQRMQDGNTSNLIFSIPFLVSYVSQFMTLLPGDIVSTGTPAGVGLGMKPAVFLKPGDVVELEIDGMGTARQKVIAYS